MQDVGIYALIHIIVHVICVCVSFWALQSLRTDQWFKANHTSQIQVLLILMSFALGSLVSNFIMDIIYFSQQLTWM
ncbi:DUF1146 family protein [Macrococcus equipercicus]|uniref:DUF1146 domain-containing protein n=1 Tax=Macrococcus equipercicus TaxID=69967 RepID=A0A9Q9BT60_9STAP|nr:DUF1146 family protein [Macrococcus equipercicus]KAA1039245.1 DUF1146 domain-containing protein [Macrococcus equipercicus]UTH13536.1 DUF1146 family protein [Macrococcus equipercicus]